jgi:hypothetical protein
MSKPFMPSTQGFAAALLLLSAACLSDAYAQGAAPANPLKPAAKPAAPATAPALAAPSTGSAVFPSSISPKYEKEKPAKARQQTCLDQYKANKDTNANGGLKWIQKGGGYYSGCNKRLKG